MPAAQNTAQAYVPVARGQGGKSQIVFGDSSPVKAPVQPVVPLVNITNTKAATDDAPAPNTGRRGRQPPGGNSSIIFG